jgi:outer membrane protein assembly factor BamD (BamD/ComL family)
MIIKKFKTYTWRIVAVYMSFFIWSNYALGQSPALAADISFSQLISFQSRNVSHVEVVMSNQNGWSVNFSQNQQSLKLGNIGNVDCLYEGWITRAYVAGVDYFQTLDFYQIKNGQNIVIYRTNSLKKYQLFFNQFTAKTIQKSSEKESLLGSASVQLLSGGLAWEYFAESSSYESNNKFTIILYNSNLVDFVRSKIAWDQLVNDDFEEEKLVDYISNYPNSANFVLAKSKLEEKRYYSAYNSGSVEIINQFLSDYPKSKYVGILKTKVEDLEYEQIFNDESKFNELNIDKFISMYPNSRYVKGLAQKKEELKFNFLLLSGDEGLIYIRYVAEKDLKKRGMLLSAIQKIRYQKVIDSFEFMSSNLQKIALINLKISDFNGTVYFGILEKKLHQLEYELLPKSLGEKCEDWQRFVQRYPNSVYAGDAKVHAQKCVELVKRNKILDSAWAVYRGLHQSDYRKIISTGEFILEVSVEKNLELQSQITALKKTYAFIQERRYKSYALNEINPNLYASHYGLIERQLINNVDGLRNAVFNSSLTFNTDTFGKSNVKVIGSNTSFFEAEVVGKLTNNFGGVNYFQLLPVMTTESHNINYSSQTSSFDMFRTGKGEFQLTTNTLSAPGYNIILSTLNGDHNYFKSGKYSIIWDEVHINNKTIRLMSIDNYRSFTGVSAILPALVVPGWGTKLVRGKKGNAWITVSTYGLAAAGAYFAMQAQKSYENYLSATTQNEMDQQYGQYLSQRSKSLISFGGAVGIYSLNLTYVIFKGMGNSIKTASYRNRYKNYSKEFN